MKKRIEYIYISNIPMMRGEGEAWFYAEKHFSLDKSEVEKNLGGRGVFF